MLIFDLFFIILRILDLCHRTYLFWNPDLYKELYKKKSSLDISDEFYVKM